MANKPITDYIPAVVRQKHYAQEAQRLIDEAENYLTGEKYFVFRHSRTHEEKEIVAMTLSDAWIVLNSGITMRQRPFWVCNLGIVVSTTNPSVK